MRKKEAMLKDLGVNAEYSAHSGIPADTKDVILIEALIDIRNEIHDFAFMVNALMDPAFKQALIDAGFLKE